MLSVLTLTSTHAAFAYTYLYVAPQLRPAPFIKFNDSWTHPRGNRLSAIGLMDWIKNMSKKAVVGRRQKRSLTQRLMRRIVYKNFARNLLYELQLRAVHEAADYAQSKMQAAQIFEDYGRYLEFGLSHSEGDGLLMEFGVAGGNSLRQIATMTSETVHGFDSFEGLPENWAGHVENRGAFSKKGALPDLPSNVELHVGWFDVTLPAMLAEYVATAKFIHIDCDIYSSTKWILENIHTRLRAGTVILFDEYFNYPSWRLHEYKAWQEFTQKNDIAYEYIAFTATDGCVAVQVSSIGPCSTKEIDGINLNQED